MSQPDVPVRKASAWWVGGPLIFILLLGVGVLLWIRWDGRSGKTSPQDGSASTESAIASAHPAKWQGPLPAEAARLFTAAKTHSERMELISNPAMDGDIMEHFFQEGAGAGENVLAIDPMGPASSHSVTFERFHVKLENGGSRLLCVILTDRGGKVDFRSYARYNSESWPDLLSGKANEATEVRVFITSGSAYLHDFSDEQTWSNYIATSPDLDDPLYFYAKRDSEVAKELAGLTGDHNRRATLAIRAVGDAARNRQFEITQVHSAGWVR